MGFKNYIIRSGNRRVSDQHIKPFFNKIRSQYDIMFTATNLTSYTNDSLMNRLFGLSFFSFFKIHTAYFGWRSSGSNIEIFACYKHKRISLMTLDVNEVYTLTLKKMNNCFTFSIFNNKNVFLCYYKLTTPPLGMFGFEQFIKLADTHGAACDMHFIMRRKY